jgi:hypothetical protein
MASKTTNTSSSSLSPTEIRPVAPVSQPIPVKGALRNKYSLLFVACVLTFVLLPDLVLNAFFFTERSPNMYFAHPFMRGILLTFCFAAVLSSWGIFILSTCFRRNAPIAPNTISSADDHEKNEKNPYDNPSVNQDYKQTFTYKSIQWLQAIMILSMCLYFGFMLIFRSASASTDCFTPLGVGDWDCNPYKDVPMYPMDTAFMLILIPNVFAIVNKDRKIYLTMVAWLIALLSMFASASLLKSKSAIVILVIYFFKSVLIFYDSFRAHFLISKLYDSLKTQMQEKQALLDQQKLNQMKDVIGNVSHDLKTVRKY